MLCDTTFCLVSYRAPLEVPLLFAVPIEGAMPELSKYRGAVIQLGHALLADHEFDGFGRKSYRVGDRVIVIDGLRIEYTIGESDTPTQSGKVMMREQVVALRIAIAF